MSVTPYAVTTPNAVTQLLIKDAKEGLPAEFALMATRAANKVALRVAGGCSNMDEADKQQMLGFFKQGLTGYQGLIWSGGTRQLTECGRIDPMVTEVPGIIAAANPGCVALGTAPRTEIMALKGAGHLVLDGEGNLPNPSMSGLLIVQNGADGSLGWDGDLDTYFGMMKQLGQAGGFTALGLIAWNGGGVTKKEIMRSAGLGWPTILIRGSGRATDAIAASVEAGEEEFEGEKIPENNQIHIVDKSNPEQLNTLLGTLGFI